MPADHIQGMTWALAHNHQIVNLTTSLPCNLYIALRYFLYKNDSIHFRYAERGMNLYTEYNQKDESSSDNSSGLDRAVRKLSFGYSRFRYNRINA